MIPGFGMEESLVFVVEILCGTDIPLVTWNVRLGILRFGHDGHCSPCRIRMNLLLVFDEDYDVRIL